jgi:hypothetical protein
MLNRHKFHSVHAQFLAAMVEEENSPHEQILKAHFDIHCHVVGQCCQVVEEQESKHNAADDDAEPFVLLISGESYDVSCQGLLIVNNHHRACACHQTQQNYEKNRHRLQFECF